MQLTLHTRRASHVIPLTSSAPNHHTRTKIRVADTCQDQGSPITTRIPPNTESAKTRHSCASSLYARGMDLKAIQELLGHEWLSTTTRYIHVHADHIERAWANANNRTAARLGKETG